MSLSAVFGQPIRLALLDDDPSFHDALTATLYAHPDLKLLNYTTDPKEIHAIVREQAPDVVLVDDGLGRESGLRVAEQLAKAFKSTMVILLTDAPSPRLWREAVAAGLRGIVRRPAMYDRESMAQWVEEHLSAVIREAIEAERRHLSRIDDDRTNSRSNGPVIRHPNAPRVISVWSAKGGVGKTTLAVNLALWAQVHPIHRIETALLDLEEGAGATHALLKVAARPTTLHWLEYRDDEEVDPAAMRRLVAELDCGLRAVFAPDSLTDSLQVDDRLTRTIIRSLRANHGLVVVDCPPSITQAVAAALEMSTVVLVVVTPELPCINKVERALEDMARHGMDLGKMRVVINRMPPRPSITEAEIASTLPCVVLGSIPEDPKMHLAVNSKDKAKLPALSDQNGPFMTGLRKVAAKIVPGLDVDNHRVGGRRLFRIPALFGGGRRS
ncbi:MAG TPA: response regulator [Thermaerobacter sp.]